MSDPHVTLTQLQRSIKTSLEAAFPKSLWVSAEVAELKVNSSGHCYLELVEKAPFTDVALSQARATIWRAVYQKVSRRFETETGQRLTAGMRILAQVSVTYHELYGFSLNVSDIDPTFTLGELERQRQLTIAQLQKDGVWDMNRELPLPLLTDRIAVISSPQAAGYQDFMEQLRRSPYRCDATIFEAVVQGAGAEDDIIAALDAIAGRLEQFDLVVIIRGGGSAVDLSCFDGYRLCAHVAQFPLPIVTGIGHDKDVSVTDMVAHTMLKTPTAVAAWLVSSKGKERFI